ncbi:hypothetical protein WJX77_012500 [Trebouxia sp. C0004]
MDFRNWILDTFTPVVMVLPSPEAEALVAQSNGLTIVDMLRPYGYFNHLSVPVRTVGEQSYRIKELKLRFYNCQNMFAPKEEDANAYLDKVLTEAATTVAADSAPDVPTDLTKGQLNLQAPWFEAYRREFLRTMTFADHETFDYPVACLLVMHAHAADPLQAYGDLFRSAPLPPLMRQGIMEPNILKHYLLLHDDAAGLPGGFPKSEERLRQMQASLGSTNCHLLRINTGKAESNSNIGYEGLWRAHIRGTLPGGGAGEPQGRPRVPPQGYGAGLSTNDMEGVARFLEEFAVRVLLPHLEVRVRSLNHQVTVSRRGLRNQLKTFLFRSKSNASSETPRAGAAAAEGSAQYGAATTEGQMRQLADLAFVMQDYETAQSTLKLLASDYKTDKAWKHLAGVQEMLALSSFMTGGAMGDVTALFREAFYRYNSVNPLQPKACVRLATRSMLLLAEYSKQHGLYAEAHAALMKAQSQESDSVRAGLLMEQAALFLLQIPPPGLRKFAFTMVLAGLKYFQHAQRSLGIRCYLQALSVYRGRSWQFIEEHIHDNLGRTFKEMGDLQSAVHHFMAVLPCPQATTALQGRYLQQFLDAVHQAGAAEGKALVLELPLPVVDVAHAHAVFDDQFSHSNAAALSFPEAHWRQLEGPFLAGSESNLVSWLDAGTKFSLVTQQHNTAVAGESVGVDVQISNPMAVGLSLTQLRAVYEHESGVTGTVNEYVKVMEQEIVVKPGDNDIVRLSILPLKPGLLRITGLEWVLNGQAQGKRLFAAKTPQHRRTGSRMPSQTKVDRSANQCLSFNIIPAAPKLEVEMHQRPGTLLEGELHRCCMVLRNVGASPLHNVRMVVSHPDVFCPMINQELQAEPMSALAASDRWSGEVSTSQPTEESSVTLKGGQTLFVWGSQSNLEGQGTLEWPLWLHPRSPGMLTFHCAWYYEPTIPVEGMKFRLLRMTQAVEVMPNLAINPTITMCPDSLHRDLLHVALTHSQDSSPLSLQQLTCTSPAWSLSHLQAPAESTPGQNPADDDAPTTSSVSCDTTLQPNGRASLFFYLHPSPSQNQASGHSSMLNPASAPIQHFHAQPNLAQPARSAPWRGAAADSLAAPNPQQGPDLLLGWRTQQGHMGVHHLYNCHLKTQPPVRILACVTAPEQHDFDTHPLCEVSVRLSLRNCLQSPASLVVESGSREGPQHQQSVPGAWQSIVRQDLPDSASTMGRLTPRPSVDASPHPGRATPRGTADLASGRNTPRASMGGPSGTSTPRRTTTESPVLSAVMPPILDASTSQQDLAPTSNYVWSGQTRVNVPDVAAGQHVDVHLHAVCFAPGTFHLSDCSVSWTYPELDNLTGSSAGPVSAFVVQQQSV